MKKQVTIYGVCWYKKEQWDRLKEIVPNYEDLDDTFEDWRKSAEKAIANIRRSGGKAQKVKVDTEEMLFWSNENNLALNAQNRAHYATYILEKRSEAKSKKK